MGGRGSFDFEAQCIPLENREYTPIGNYGNISIIEGITTTNGKTPVMSNRANSIYAVYSQNAGRIKHVFYYENHILTKTIDLEGSKSHWHNVTVDPKTGSIGRISHDEGNVFKPNAEMWNLINFLSKWRKK